MNSFPPVETTGQIIKRLRRTKKLTQEDLAEMLGVSVQAVSRWENDLGMPDISKILPLANIFDVSTDILLGRVNPNDKEVDAFLAAMLKDEFEHIYTTNEEYIIWKLDRLKEFRCRLDSYPNSVKLLRGVISESFGIVYEYETEDKTISPGQIQTILKDCVRMAERIERLTDQTENKDDYYHAMTDKIKAYTLLGKPDKAEEIALSLPKLCKYSYYAQCAEIAMFSEKAKNEIEMRNKTILELLNELDYQTVLLGHAYKAQNKYEDARSCYTFLRHVEAALYGEDAWTPPFTSNGMFYFGCTAMCLCQEGHEEDAITLLEEYVDYCIRHAEAWNTHINKPSSSPLLRYCQWKYNDSYVKNAKQELTEEVVNRFAFLQGNPRYDAVVQKIEELPSE